MRRVFRYVLVWLLALSFAASGVAWRHCATAQAAPAPQTTLSTAGHETHGAAHGHVHGDHGVPHQHATDQPVPVDGNQTFFKCCSMCIVVGVMPPAVDAAVFAASFVNFADRSDLWIGNSIRVEPGIPKRIFGI